MFKEDAKSITANDFHPIFAVLFYVIASTDTSLGATSSVAKGPVRVDVSTLKQLPRNQMGLFGK